MKKNLLLLAFVVASGITGCGAKNGIEVALVTDSGTINDESFNQAAWEGIEAYCKENKKEYKYFQPVTDTNEERMNSIDAAVKEGAKIVILPGYLFEPVICNASVKHADTKFVLLDGSYTNDSEFGDVYDASKSYDNVYCVSYKEEQPGFLAGYAAVKDSYTKLGFLGGMAVPAVKRYGYGYLQGMEVAAKELDVSVTCNYYYAGQFFASDTSNQLVDTWIKQGTEVVFGCGGGVYTSIEDAIQLNNKGKMIGVDVDQSKSVGDFVITSAMKGLKETVVSSLTTFFGEKWSDIGSQVATLGLGTTAAPTDFVGLPTEDSSWKFSKFTKAEYEAVISKIRSGEITIKDDVKDVISGDELEAHLGLTKVDINFVA